jgi:hypothetical protein
MSRNTDGSGLDAALFLEFHQGMLRRLHAHEPEKLLGLLDEGFRVTVPAHVTPVETDHETVYQPEFHRIVSRPKPEVLESAAATVRLENATEVRAAAQEQRPPALKAEPVRAFWTEIDTADGRRIRRAVFPGARLVHVFPGGSPAVATEDQHTLTEGDVLTGCKSLGAGRPGVIPPVKIGGQPT